MIAQLFVKDSSPNKHFRHSKHFKHLKWISTVLLAAEVIFIYTKQGNTTVNLNVTSTNRKAEIQLS